MTGEWIEGTSLSFLVGMLYWNYYLTVSTDPGRVPKLWVSCTIYLKSLAFQPLSAFSFHKQPNFQADEGYEVKRLSGSPRYCRMCDAYKPPRSHHCRQCKRCVLRMDHHCPWVNNCVGHYNYGHFIRFLFFVDVACSYHFLMITRRSVDAMNSKYWVRPSLGSVP